MRRFDRFIRDQRIAQAVRFVRPGSRVFDIGCHDGALFRALGPALREGVGLDPDLAGPLAGPNYSLYPGWFPADAPAESEAFDAVCALAVLEHVEAPQRDDFAAAIAKLLVPGGDAILTVPAPAVDRMLDVMMRIRVIDGMEAEQHHGFAVSDVQPLFETAGLVLDRHEAFQFGLNNLFVFHKPAQ